ncbi:MAG: hypothetical protein CMK36_00955 [Porticoccaceae bacterium]|nr:hypothetical protein [Porticoccaceae bacterium]|tara:strand:- start:4536 stop:5192 length:657 start_codon:yes stop_codon:yes gene_type:complete
MTVTKWIWLLMGIIYTTFFIWYTSFEGPITQEEMERYLDSASRMHGFSSQDNISNLREFMENDSGDDFVMINIGHLYDEPLLIEGVTPGETSQEVQSKYMEYMFPAMLRRASHPMFMGKAASPRAFDAINVDGLETWSGFAGVRYRSRRDLMDIVLNPKFDGVHKLKVASIAKSIAFPIDPFSHLGDPRLLLALLFSLIGCVVGWYYSNDHRSVSLEN